MGGSTADPVQDPRGAPDLTPLWAIFDNTPEKLGGLLSKVDLSQRLPVLRWADKSVALNQLRKIK